MCVGAWNLHSKGISVAVKVKPFSRIPCMHAERVTQDENGIYMDERSHSGSGTSHRPKMPDIPTCSGFNWCGKIGRNLVSFQAFGLRSSLILTSFHSNYLKCEKKSYEIFVDISMSESKLNKWFWLCSFGIRAQIFKFGRDVGRKSVRLGSYYGPERKKNSHIRTRSPSGNFSHSFAYLTQYYSTDEIIKWFLVYLFSAQCHLLHMQMNAKRT